MREHITKKPFPLLRLRRYLLLLSFCFFPIFLWGQKEEASFFVQDTMIISLPNPPKNTKDESGTWVDTKEEVHYLPITYHCFCKDSTFKATHVYYPFTILNPTSDTLVLTAKASSGGNIFNIVSRYILPFSSTSAIHVQYVHPQTQHVRPTVTILSRVLDQPRRESLLVLSMDGQFFYKK